MTSRLALFAVLLAGVGYQPVASVHRARLAGPATSPLSVRGTLFRANERVVVVAQANGTHRRTVTSTARGTFLVRFAGVALGNCASYVIRATGNRGSYAVLRVIPECAAP
jgi:hypothetical protein